MSKSAEERLADLEKLVLAQNAKLQKGLKTTIVVYLILIVVVFAYTFYAAGKIQELTSRQGVAEMVGAQLKETLPEQRAALMEKLNANAQTMAKDAVQSMVDNVPALENQVQNLLDGYTDQLVADLHTSLMPAFTDYVKQDSAEIKEHFDNLTDEEVVQGTVEIMIDVIEQEMDKYINERFENSLIDLQKAVTKLGNPKAKLTKREDAERRVIMYWTVLTEISDTGTSPFETMFNHINERYHFFSGEDLEQLKTPLGDHEDVKGAIETE